MRMILVAASLVVASPAAAQEGRPLDRLLELFAERTEEAVRDMMVEITPELEALARELGPEIDRMMMRIVPELQALGDVLGGIDQYEMPEVLPNGDIIIRRRSSAPPVDRDTLDGLIDPNDSIEL